MRFALPPLGVAVEPVVLLYISSDDMMKKYFIILYLTVKRFFFNFSCPEAKILECVCCFLM